MGEFFYALYRSSSPIFGLHFLTNWQMHFQIRNDDTFKRLFAQALNEVIIARRQVSEREVYYSLATPKINDEPELF